MYSENLCTRSGQKYPKLRYYTKFKTYVPTGSCIKANITPTRCSLLAQLHILIYEWPLKLIDTIGFHWEKNYKVCIEI